MLDRMTPVAIGCTAMALAALVSNFVMVGMRWATLPDQVPRHFGLSGRPDAWGGKRIIWTYPVMSLAMFLVVGGVYVMETLVGNMALSPKDAEIVAVIAAYLAVVMLIITLRTFAVAEKPADGLGRMFVPVLMLGVIVIVLRYRG